MITPPDAVLSFSYIRGCFVYCPFLLDLFTPKSLFSISFNFSVEAVSDPFCAASAGRGAVPYHFPHTRFP